MASGNDFQTYVFCGCWVNGEVGRDVLDATGMVVCMGVQVCLEAVAAGLLVIDFVFEEDACPNRLTNY